MPRSFKGSTIGRILLFVLSSLLPAYSQVKWDIGSPMPKINVSEQSKNILEEMPTLRANITNFLYYDSRGNGKARDYRGMYSLLSQKYLSENFRDVKSADEYVDDMENYDEIYHQVYLLIEHIDFIQEDVAKIKLQLETASEGDLQIMEEEIFFRNEGGSWKYDGMDVESLKTIKMLEK